MLEIFKYPFTFSTGTKMFDCMCRYDLQFSSVLFSLLDRISQLGRDNYNEKERKLKHNIQLFPVLPIWSINVI